MDNGYQMKKRQTDAYLYKAMLECLETTRWENLTVTALCAQAQIGRKTFYRHFCDRQALLDGWFEQRAAEYVDRVCPLDRYDLPKILEEFFLFWQPWKEALHILRQAGAPWKECLWNQAPMVIRARAPRNLPYFETFSAGGFLALLTLWTEQGFQPEAGAMAKECAWQIIRHRADRC